MSDDNESFESVQSEEMEALTNSNINQPNNITNDNKPKGGFSFIKKKMQFLQKKKDSKPEWNWLLAKIISPNQY